MPERALRCTDEELQLLVPLGQLDDVRRHALTRWLWQHQITPSTLEVGLPLLRDSFNSVLAWHERDDDGTVRRRWRYWPTMDRGWPAPFPAAIRRAGVGADERDQERPEPQPRRA